MFERFAPSAILIILRAQQEARRQRHNYVGTEQVLLALINNEERKFTKPGLEQPPLIAAKVFEKYGVTLEAARMNNDPLDTTKTLVDVGIPFTAPCKRLIEQSWALADELQDLEIDTEHLLVALLQDEEGPAHEVLTALHLDKQGLREEALKLRAERRNVQ